MLHGKKKEQNCIPKQNKNKICVGLFFCKRKGGKKGGGGIIYHNRNVALLHICNNLHAWGRRGKGVSAELALVMAITGKKTHFKKVNQSYTHTHHTHMCAYMSVYQGNIRITKCKMIIQFLLL